jgi:phospholipid transport system transporter-binding protein
MTSLCPTAEVPSGGFTASDEGWSYKGALTVDNATGVFEATQELPLPDTGRLDFGGLEKADSAALAVIIELLRRGKQEGRELAISNLPPSLAALAQVYGIEEIVQAIPTPERRDAVRQTSDA